ncbi:hypothetical protein GOEFS_092_00860 [Gordonia effusa NBRC 100432]|uniref:DUF4097 domain-containing protein n=1 Tax=Gordonia effusa NBRC 100432 TaxID=1077974 RepID=H0R3L0_9ACTN|nr:DUF4097 family beta strand repeat-containing protein [Gordonia effusa]GAB19661.1 hypothetical protein GOEFS_092_00860 [Gordonia effusa NBRC 100432]
MTTYPLTGPLTVELDLTIGDVRIIASDRDDADVTIRPQLPGKASSTRAAEQTTATLTGNRLRIHSTRSWRTFTPFGSPDAVDIIIEIPSGTSITGSLGVGSIRSEGTLGSCVLDISHADLDAESTATLTVKSNSGSVTAGSVAGDATVTASYGAVRLREVAGTLAVKASYGDISLGTVRGALQIRGAYGAIDVDHALDSVGVKTAHGRTAIREVRRGAVTAESSYGAIEIGIHDGTAAWLDVNSDYGQFHNELTPSTTPGSDDDTVEVRAHTSFGNITVTRTRSNFTKEAS